MQRAGEFFNISPMVLGGCLDKYRRVDACLSLSLAHSHTQPPKLLIKSNLEEGSGKKGEKIWNVPRSFVFLAPDPPAEGISMQAFCVCGGG